MTQRSEYFAGKTENSVTVNVEADTTAGGWAIRRRLGNEWLSASRTDCALPCVELKTESFQTFGTQLALTEHA